MLTFRVPPGIGDISWVYAKVSEIAKTRDVGFVITEDYLPRSSPYVDILPNITNLGYQAWWSIPYLLKNSLPIDTDLSALEDGEYLLAVNTPLENGVLLRDIYPKQATDYHYQIQGNTSDCRKASKLTANTPTVGFYCSSRKHRPDSQFWEVSIWLEFLCQVSDMIPGVTLCALGCDYDDKTKDVLSAAKLAGLNAIDGMNLSIGSTLEVIRRLDYFFAFPSGLGILADVVDTPCMMWLFPEIEKLGGTYADPVNTASGKHINLVYCDLEDSLDKFAKDGLVHVQKSL